MTITLRHAALYEGTIFRGDLNPGDNDSDVADLWEFRNGKDIQKNSYWKIVDPTTK